MHQFQTDANDMEAWIMETLRQVSSQEVGHDEFSTQTLARKQREIEEEIQSHHPVIDSLHEQVQALPEAYLHYPEVCALRLYTVILMVSRCGAAITDRLSPPAG